MSTVQSPVSDMLITVKTREIQRGMLAEMRADPETSSTHFLAAAYLELVLAEDYRRAGQDDLSVRSRISAATCFWRANRLSEARQIFSELEQENPALASEIQQLTRELSAF